MIREYLGRRFGFDCARDDHRRAGRPARAARAARADPRARSRAGSRRCDLVKFAKIAPTPRRGARRARDGHPHRGVDAAAARAAGDRGGPPTRPRRGPAEAAHGRRRTDAAAGRRRAARAPASPTPSSPACSCRSRWPISGSAAHTSRASASPTRGALALIPLAVALVLWAGLRRGPGAGAVLRLLARRASSARSAAASWRACADLPRCCGSRRWCSMGVALARPQTRARRRRSRASRASTSSSRSMCRARWRRPI